MEDFTPASSIMRLKISGMTENEKASELRQLEEYFNLLEEDRRRLQNLLQEQRDMHVMSLNTLERQRIQEKLEWEKLTQKREEALYSAFLSVAIRRERLMKDLIARQSTTNLQVTAENPPKVSLEKQSRNWCFLRKHQTTSGVALKDSNCVSANKEVADLQRIAKLEERVRKSELKKRQKAIQKAEQQAKKAAKKALKAEQRAQKERRKAENMDDEAKGTSSKGPSNQNVMYINMDGQEIVVHYPVRCKCLFCIIGRKRMAKRKEVPDQK